MRREDGFQRGKNLWLRGGEIFRLEWIFFVIIELVFGGGCFGSGHFPFDHAIATRANGST